MTRTIAVGLALAPFAIVAACSSFGGTEGSTPSDAGTADEPERTQSPSVDGSSGADTSDADSAGVLDAGADAFDGCTPLVDDDFTGNELDPSWIVAGSQPKIGFNGELVLIDSTPNTASAVWHAAPSPKGATLRISVELHISPTTEGIADGMAIAWAPPYKSDTTGAFLANVGGGAGNLAICPDTQGHGGPTGAMGVGLLTYDKASSGFPPRHLSFLDQTSNPCEQTIVTPVTLPANGIMPVKLDVGGFKLSGSELGTFEYTLPRDIEIGWVGFGAGTGAFDSHEAIAHVHVSSCQ